MTISEKNKYTYFNMNFMQTSKTVITLSDTQVHDDLAVLEIFPLLQEVLEHQRRATTRKEKVMSELMARLIDEGR